MSGSAVARFHAEMAEKLAAAEERLQRIWNVTNGRELGVDTVRALITINHILAEPPAIAAPPAPSAVEKAERAVIEALAEQAHVSWSGWIDWMLAKIDETHSSGETFRDCWRRQARTPYADLTEAEKNSDREEALHYLEIFRAAEREAQQ